MARKNPRAKRKGSPASTPRTFDLPTLDTRWWWLVLAAVTLLAYARAWHGGLLWDDDRHLTRAALQSLRGLWSIWFDVGATQQYYPVTHSAFWLQHQLWGSATLGYHLVNILLHATSAFLVLRILQKLEVPGAVLAALIFALHPLNVESVAWISELKNTLSGVLVLAAAWTYLSFDQTRARRDYLAALGLFVVALLTKSVTAPLPAVLLVVIWWKRGRIDVRQDALPLAPFVGLALVAGAATIWVERTLIGAEGAEFEFSLIERCLIAGRVVWFYALKIVWPYPLSFNYPRWIVSQAVWWQYLFPLAALAAGAATWLIRGRTRAPLAVFLMFGGLLVPVLGFLNVYPFRFSFVADHFVYLAGIPVFALLAAGAALGARRLEWGPPARMAGGAVIVAGLGVLTFFHARNFASAEALYRHALRVNPDSWLAHNNLAGTLVTTNLDEALFHVNEAVRLNPADPSIRNDRGILLLRGGSIDTAEAEFREAIRLLPTFADAHNNLCNSLDIQHEFNEAIISCRESLRLAPDFADAHYNLGLALLGLGQADAADAFAAALRLRPELAEAHYYLGGLLHLRGDLEGARTRLEEAIRIKPQLADAHYSLGRVLQTMGRDAEAMPHYETALRLQPESAAAHNSLGVVLTKIGRADEALKHFEEAVRLVPSYGEARANLIIARERQAKK
jgi:tetratricopeptide (TPR) repeat protein